MQLGPKNGKMTDKSKRMIHAWPVENRKHNN